MQRLPGSKCIAWLVFVVSFAEACRHDAGTAPVPGGTPSSTKSKTTEAGTTAKQSELIADQVNEAGWQKAWTNLVNDAEQSFQPTMPRLTGAEVLLVVGNPGPAEDRLELTVSDASGNPIATESQTVEAKNCERVVFEFPNQGIAVTPGATYRIRLQGGLLFGWKYVIGGYPNGEATFNGRPLVADTRSTFLFRTFGEK